MLCSKRDESLGRNYAWNSLELVVEQVHKLLVIAGIELQEHGVRTGCEVTLHNLRDILKSLYHLLVHITTLQVKSHVCTGGYNPGS